MLYVNPLETYGASSAKALTNDSQRREVAVRELEHFFLFMLLQEMRKTIPMGDGNDTGHELRLYHEMLDDALSGEMAKSGQLGIAKQIEGQLVLGEMQRQLQNTTDWVP